MVVVMLFCCFFLVLLKFGFSFLSVFLCFLFGVMLFHWPQYVLGSSARSEFVSLIASGCLDWLMFFVFVIGYLFGINFFLLCSVFVFSLR